MTRSLRPATSRIALSILTLMMLLFVIGIVRMPDVSAQAGDSSEEGSPSFVEPGSLPVVQVTASLSADAVPALVQAADGKLLVVFSRYGELWASASTDRGATWTAEVRVGDCCRSSPGLARDADGVLWLTYERSGDIWYRTSADHGVTWTAESRVPTDPGDDFDATVYATPDGDVGVVWRAYRVIEGGDVVQVGLFHKRSADNGATWTPDANLTEEAYAPAAAARQDGRLLVVYNRGEGELWQRMSTDGGATWSTEARIAGCCRRNPSVASAGGVFWLTYENDGDIWYRTSSSGGATWSSEALYTHYVGPDRTPATTVLASGAPAIAWESDRSGSSDIWYGSPGERDDMNPPPYVEWIERLPRCNLDSNTVVTVRARVLDESGVSRVDLLSSLNGTDREPEPMYDDGTHGDDMPGDAVWAVQFGPFPQDSQVIYSVRATDTRDNTFQSMQNGFTVLPLFARTAGILFVPDTSGTNPSSFRAYYTAALDAQGYTYDTWDISLRCYPDDAVLEKYQDGIVIWAAAHWMGDITGLTAALKGYLDGGGKLFVTGQDIGQSLEWGGNREFLNNYLHARFVQEDSRLLNLAGVPTSPIGAGLALSISGGDGAGDQWSTDEIDVVAPAQAVFTYDAGAAAAFAEGVSPAGAVHATSAQASHFLTRSEEASHPDITPAVLPSPTPAPPPTAVPIPPVTPTRLPTVTPVAPANACLGSCTAGLSVDTGSYRVVYFAFGFEAIADANERAEVMGRVLGWLSNSVALLTPTSGQILRSGKVTFTWTGSEVPNYDIQIDRTPAFDSPDLVAEVVTVARYEHTFSGLGQWHWRVRPGGGGWTAARSFTLTDDVVQVTADGADDATPALVEVRDGELLAVFVRNGRLWSRSSKDRGATWGPETQIAPCCHYNPSLTRAADGKLWLAYQREGDIWYRFSTDGGVTWSAERQLPTESGDDSEPAIVQAAGGKLWIVWLGSSEGYPRHVVYKTSTNGLDWSETGTLSTQPWDNDSPTVAVTAAGRIVVVWRRYDGLRQRTTGDGGATWTEERQVSECCGYERPSLADGAGKLWLVYDRDGDILYRISTNQGDAWSAETTFTRFTGPDQAPAAAVLASGQLGIGWQSDRRSNPDIWFGSVGGRSDLDPPPYVSDVHHEPANPDGNNAVTFRAWAGDEVRVASVVLVWKLNGVTQADLEMYDDGTHGDNAPGDQIWSLQHAPFPYASQVTYRVRADDVTGNSYAYPGEGSFRVLPAFVSGSRILLVLDAGGTNLPSDTTWFRPYYTEALDALGYHYDVWDTGLRGEPAASLLSQYKSGAVIWAVPYWGYLTSWGTNSTGQLQDYLRAGGRLFITGQNIGENLSWGSFLMDYLHATAKQGDTGLYALAGTPEDPIGDGLALNISGGDGANDQYSKDEIDPISPAEVVLTYRAGDSSMLAQPVQPAGGLPPSPPGGGSPAGNIGSGTAGLRVATGGYKAVYFAFGFEAINSASSRREVLERVLAWLGADPGVRVYLPLIQR